MIRYPITTGMQTVTAAGPVTGTLSTAGLPNLSTIYLEVSGLTSGTTRISIEDSATGTFGDALPVKVWHFEGESDTVMFLQHPTQLRIARKHLEHGYGRFWR